MNAYVERYLADVLLAIETLDRLVLDAPRDAWERPAPGSDGTDGTVGSIVRHAAAQLAIVPLMMAGRAPADPARISGPAADAWVRFVPYADAALRAEPTVEANRILPYLIGLSDELWTCASTLSAALRGATGAGTDLAGGPSPVAGPPFDEQRFHGQSA